jgi:L-aminopeptidase/D-esterase-like protein
VIGRFALLGVCLALGAAAGGAQSGVQGLTAVAGIKVGHDTLSTGTSGCTVIIMEAGAVAGVDVRGSAPATRETDLLEPDNLVDKIQAVFLSGGSAFGLDTGSGVMRYLEERKIGFRFGPATVPVVPGAALFDLPVGDNARNRPDAQCGYAAAKAASGGAIAEGTVGAGAGATVGKFAGGGRPMKGGIGTASATLPSGLIVAALVATNGGGDIIDPATGRIVAGARGSDGVSFVDARKALRSGALEKPRPREHTTLGVVATNAVLTKAQARKMAEMAHDGFARAIFPSHTMGDGDTIFALSTGVHQGDVNMTLVGGLAADVMVEAILRSVRAATGLPDIPAVRDLPPAK